MITEQQLRGEIPEELVVPIINYLAYGYHPGDTLEALFASDLATFINRAPQNVVEALPSLVAFIKLFPAACYGSKARVESWREEGGMLGKKLVN